VAENEGRVMAEATIADFVLCGDGKWHWDIWSAEPDTPLASGVADSLKQALMDASHWCVDENKKVEG